MLPPLSTGFPSASAAVTAAIAQIRCNFRICYNVSRARPSTTSPHGERSCREVARERNKIFADNRNANVFVLALGWQHLGSSPLSGRPQDHAIARRASDREKGGLRVLQRIVRAGLDRERLEMSAGEAGTEFPEHRAGRDG